MSDETFILLLYGALALGFVVLTHVIAIAIGCWCAPKGSMTPFGYKGPPDPPWGLP
jgi:hypothetical protein